MADHPDKKVTTYEGWISVFEGSTDFEADLIRDRLDEADVPAVVLTQRDHAFNLNVGDLAEVHVLVPPQHVEAAREILDAAPISDEELERQALDAEPQPDAHDLDREARLDSGLDRMDLGDVSEKD